MSAQHTPGLWVNPNDKTQKQYLPWISQKVLFCHDGQTYYGHHTGGSFVTGQGVSSKYFDTWDCFWMYPPKAVTKGEAEIILLREEISGPLKERAELLEALKLADRLLSGANMNRTVVERKVRSAISKATGATP